MNADVSLVALVFEDQGNVPPARDARGVEHQHMFPSSIGLPQRADQRLEARPIFVFARLHSVGKFVDHCEILGMCQVVECSTLGVERNVTAILAAAQVEGGAIRHSLERS
ncbi:MAG: hypothetical protein WBG17_14075 [Burkholderiaceae bacterium]